MVEEPTDVAGLRLLLRHLDLLGGFAELTTDSERFVQGGLNPDGPIWPGLILLTLWAGSAIASHRIGHMVLQRLNVVLGITLALTVVSMSRILGSDDDSCGILSDLLLGSVARVRREVPIRGQSDSCRAFTISY